METKPGIIGVLLAIILALVFLPPAIAQGNTKEVTITMDTESVMAITLSQTNWGPEDGTWIVNSNKEYKTDLPATWCTITNAGNASVNIHIKGDDAKWVDRPNDYKWVLITDESHVSDQERPHEYALWYHIALDTADSYTLITKTEPPMKWTKNGNALNLKAHGATRQFGLKLLTPTYFDSDRKMQTRITISAVAA